MAQKEVLSGTAILILEDDYFLANSAKDSLKRAGAIVVGPVASEEEALAILAVRRIDAAVIDIDLGEGPAFTIARELQQKGTAFIFTTGYDASVVPHELRDIARLEKPFADNSLVEAVSGII